MFRFILTFLTIVSPALASSNSNRAQDFNQKIKLYQSHVQRGDYIQARKVLEGLNNSHRNNSALRSWWANYHFNLGQKAQSQKNFFEASRSYSKALEFKESESYIKLLIHSQFNQKDFFGATQSIERYGSKLSPKYQLSLVFLLAKAYANMENFNAAIYELRKAKNLHPREPKIFASLAEYHMKNKDNETAVESLEALAKIRPLNDKEKQTLSQARKSHSIKSQYQHAISASFEVHIDKDKYSRHLPKIIQTLNRAYMELGRTFDYYPTNKTRIMILTEQDYNHATDGAKGTVGLRYNNSDEIYVRIGKTNNFESPRELENTLWHEYNHHLLMQITKGYGQVSHWFVEGVASYLEPHEPKQHQKILKQLMKKGQLFAAGKLPPRMMGYPMYVMARSMVQKLDQNGDLAPVLEGLKDLNYTVHFPQIFEEITGLSESEFAQLWNEWIQSELKKRPDVEIASAKKGPFHARARKPRSR